MSQTRLMQADDIAAAFNGTADRKYWQASVGGTRVSPAVNFNSRASMVTVSYRIATGDFVVSFSSAQTAFGDFLASAQRSMEQILAALIASGASIPVWLNDIGRLRVEYEPATKTACVSLAGIGDPWQTFEPLRFKGPVRNRAPIGEDNSETPLDAGSTND